MSLLLRLSDSGTLCREFSPETLCAVEHMLHISQVVLATEQRTQPLHVDVRSDAQLRVRLRRAMGDYEPACCHAQHGLGFRLRLATAQRHGVSQRFFAAAERGLQNADATGVAIQLTADGL